jgi:hypothetical protein
MKKKRITYGVSGMMEYQSIIRFGKNTLKVTFTGGSMNAIGVTPATYTTSSFLIQQAIENSNEFKRGRIRIVRTIELDEEIHIERPKPATAIAERRNPTPTPTPTPTAEAEKVPETTEEAEAAEVNAEDSATSEEQPEEAAPTEPLTQVEFSCNDDAKDYLEQTFGYVRSKLRNREDIINAGKAHNVEIIFV